jgi:DNA-binding transcriptional MerR regulator
VRARQEDPLEKRVTIGQLSEMTKVPPKTIRYYEEAGIIPPPQRSSARYRVYSEMDVRRLELIRRSRMLDMTLSEVRQLVEWASTGSCSDFQGKFLEAVRSKIGEVDQRIMDLQKLREDLTHLEAHLVANEEAAHREHSMLACAPETCTCLGNKSIS